MLTRLGLGLVRAEDPDHQSVALHLFENDFTEPYRIALATSGVLDDPLRDNLSEGDGAISQI